MPNDFSGFSAEFESREHQGLYRRRRILDGPQNVIVDTGGRPLINFCSNDYLGLANHPAVCAAFKNAVDLFGVGSGSAHLICGHGKAHHALEEELAAFTGRDRSLLFSTGYMANMGVISALLGHGDTVFEDRLNHASLLDGALLSRARLRRYKHADPRDLQTKLQDCQTRAMIVSDGVFSMDGDLAPLPELAALASQYQAGLFVDDAHGFGVLGQHGAGITEYYGLTQRQVPILMGTLGKAFGGFGAFVAGSDELIEMLIQTARTYIYTTALPPAVAEAGRAGLKISRNESWRREKLQNLILRFKNGAKQQDIRLLDSNTAIQPIIIGDSKQTVEVSNRLLELGFWVSAIRPPTVPAGASRLRITFSANHEDWHIDSLLEALSKVLI